jgi:hypothetical protein
MNLRHVAALPAIAILIAGCGSQNPPNNTVADLGCKVSAQTAEQICQMAANELKLNPAQGTNPYEQNRNAITTTVSVSYPVKTLQGVTAAQAFCEINRIHYSLVYAKLVSGPATKEQADYLQSQGLCSDSN